MILVMVVVNPEAEVWMSGRMAGQTVGLLSRATAEWAGETIYISGSVTSAIGERASTRDKNFPLN
jgi:hypothetical protein